MTTTASLALSHHFARGGAAGVLALVVLAAIAAGRLAREVQLRRRRRW